jgi:hypothetical protein
VSGVTPEQARAGGHDVVAGMEPARGERDDGVEVPGLVGAHVAAMEPAGDRQDDPRTRRRGRSCRSGRNGACR